MAITGVTYDSDYKPTPKRVPIPVDIKQELRIGSYILYNDMLLKVDYDFFSKLVYGGPKIEGIPITEELLLLLGFKIQINHDYRKIDPYKSDDDEDNYVEYESSRYYFHRSQIPLHESPSPPSFIYRDKKFQILDGGYKDCKYLHQYQNLFLGKMNEEMIIDEQKLRDYINENKNKVS